MLKTNASSSILLPIFFLLTLFMFACSGGDSGQQDMDTNASSDQGESTDNDTAMDENIRTINIIGIDDLKFALEQEMSGITVG